MKSERNLSRGTYKPEEEARERIVVIGERVERVGCVEWRGWNGIRQEEM